MVTCDGIIKLNSIVPQNIRVDVEFGAMHFGYVEFDLCPQEAETNGCFQSLILTGGSHRLRNNRQMCVPLDGTTTRREFTNVQLPAGVRCARCTLRWTYRTSYPGPANWDPCFDARPLAQTFRGNIKKKTFSRENFNFFILNLT